MKVATPVLSVVRFWWDWVFPALITKKTGCFFSMEPSRSRALICREKQGENHAYIQPAKSALEERLTGMGNLYERHSVGPRKLRAGWPLLKRGVGLRTRQR